MTTVAHDARGFERMYRRHVSAVYRYALAVIGNQADAEDATQQTFLSAYRAWERGERPRRAHNWLITIAHNVCRQRFRERSRRPAEVELEADAVPTSVDERLEAADLTTALGQLQFNQRAALVMRELEGRSYDEIAGILGVSHSAVETLLFRARRALREQLEGELTCGEAERAWSRRLDSELPRAEVASLRAHTRLRGLRHARAAYARPARRPPWPGLPAAVVARVLRRRRDDGCERGPAREGRRRSGRRGARRRRRHARSRPPAARACRGAAHHARDGGDDVSRRGPARPPSRDEDDRRQAPARYDEAETLAACRRPPAAGRAARAGAVVHDDDGRRRTDTSSTRCRHRCRADAARHADGDRPAGHHRHGADHTRGP